jgi:hypothetical protein
MDLNECLSLIEFSVDLWRIIRELYLEDYLDPSTIINNSDLMYEN